MERNGQNHKKRFITMGDINVFAKKEKELVILIQTIRIYSLDIGMEYSIEKCAMLRLENGNREAEGILKDKICNIKEF